MSEIINGKEALIALANDQGVEYMDTSNTFKSIGWINAFGLSTNLFFSDRFKFRMKPNTININGIEVPAPFEPKDGERYWRPSFGNFFGYDDFIMDDTRVKGIELMLGAWRTEEEIKQVVSALRSIFKRRL